MGRDLEMMRDLEGFGEIWRHGERWIEMERDGVRFGEMKRHGERCGQMGRDLEMERD